MAQAVSNYNLKFTKNIKFGGLYFATDYLRASKEAKLNLKFDMANSRSKVARKEKAKILKQIIELLIKYLKL